MSRRRRRRSVELSMCALAEEGCGHLSCECKTVSLVKSNSVCKSFHGITLVFMKVTECCAGDSESIDELDLSEQDSNGVQYEVFDITNVAYRLAPQSRAYFMSPTFSSPSMLEYPKEGC